MRTYGTMGTIGGTGTPVPGATLTSDTFDVPEYIIGEGVKLHPLPACLESSRRQTGRNQRGALRFRR